MQVKSPAILYTDVYLRQIREKVHWARIPSQYKFMIRNMIKLLALHGIYKEANKDDPDWRQLVGDYINEKRKTKGALPESERRAKIVQANIDRRYARINETRYSHVDPFFEEEEPEHGEIYGTTNNTHIQYTSTSQTISPR